jgi:NADH-quinone oxidoreductase subunit L
VDVSGLLWLIPVAPLAAFAVNAAVALATSRPGRHAPHGLVGAVACLGPFVSFLVSVAAFMQLRGHGEAERRITQTLYTWIASGSLQIDVGLVVDTLSGLMLLFVTGVGTLIHVYSVAYMHEDEGFARYFAYLNLFMVAMLLLVMADSLPVLFVGWEGVGLCSYLLIGYWYEDPEKASAGKKAFVVNRIGDFGVLLAMFLIFWRRPASTSWRASASCTRWRRWRCPSWRSSAPSPPSSPPPSAWRRTTSRRCWRTPP